MVTHQSTGLKMTALTAREPLDAASGIPLSYDSTEQFVVDRDVLNEA